ncbi:hypothetical protein GCM10011349_25500 [Novosphingobium indicum]|uniref:Uncharacterized protein n=1 Tax=Novosphingobium indicum TaxID=462949 RepID=A0ABQ2JSN2_9SPHN|nr:hypothetical protein GCM10011349_25500 [Novosphingobium indicum]
MRIYGAAHRLAGNRVVVRDGEPGVAHDDIVWDPVIDSVQGDGALATVRGGNVIVGRWSISNFEHIRILIQAAAVCPGEG